MKFYSILFLSCLVNFQLAALSNQDSLSLEAYIKNQQIEAELTEEGLFYHIEEYGSGDYAKPGNYVMIKYKGSLLNGTVFDESPEDEPYVFQLGYRQVILGKEIGLTFFQVGSKGRLFVPSELGYGRNGAGKMVPPNASLIYEIELLQIMNFEEYDAYMIENEKRARAKYKAEMEAQFIADKKLIQEYLIDHKIRKSKRLPSGVSYVITKKGKGDNAKAGDQVEINYTGYLIDDTEFDSSKKLGAFKFRLGKRKAIKGLEKALPYFNKGSEGWILIPSKLAYGPRAIEEEDISIPANSVLIFKVKMEGIN